MEVSKPNENGVLPEGCYEIVAHHGRAYAAVRIALCEDGLYRSSVDMRYGHGGFSSPISVHDDGYIAINAARDAALAELLRRWHTPFPSDPQSVRDELRILLEQIDRQLSQPSLF